MTAVTDHQYFLPAAVAKLENPQTEIPRIAKDKELIQQIESAIQEIPTTHRQAL